MSDYTVCLGFNNDIWSAIIYCTLIKLILEPIRHSKTQRTDM